MKKLGMLLALCFAFTLAMMAQDNMGSLGQSADQTTTKTTKHHMKGTKEHSLTGCLSEGTSPGTYVLERGKHKTMVTGSDELKSHVGHEVKLTGAWETGVMSEGSESAATEANEKKTGKEEHEFKVSNITHIADTCAAGAKSKKSKSDMGGTGF
ncbi:MAG TPA: hypothetical protein VGR48_06305 [Terriglobales bacterium]|nr:hypothetical protein [Terriglobales bacterium]